MNINLVRKFNETLVKDKYLKILATKKNNEWQWTSRYDLNNMINNCIFKLKDYNISKGERIIYKGNNSIEWISWNLAALSMGAVWVPMYNTQTSSQCKYISSDCDAKLLISNDNIKIDNINCISNNIPDLNYKNKEVDLIYNDLSTLIYTSGTTGNPKGVMLSHDNIISNLEGIRKRFNNMESNKVSLNILPWAHIYSMTCELYYNLLYDNSIAISTGKDNFMQECKEIKPNAIYIVPKVLENVKNKVQILNNPIIKHLLPLVLNRIFGNNLENIFMGGAKLDNNTKFFFDTYGIKICEGY